MTTFSTGEAAAGLPSAVFWAFSASIICMDIIATPVFVCCFKFGHAKAKRREERKRSLAFFPLCVLRASRWEGGAYLNQHRRRRQQGHRDPRGTKKCTWQDWQTSSGVTQRKRNTHREGREGRALAQQHEARERGFVAPTSPFNSSGRDNPKKQKTEKSERECARVYATHFPLNVA